MLGHDVVARTRAAGRTVRTLGRHDGDLLDLEHLRRLVVGCEVVVNCAAWTDVDGAEAEPDAAFRANSLLPEALARACSAEGSRLVQVSTDYVFAGDASSPYEVDDLTDPRSVYGRSKLAGEEAVRGVDPSHLVVRTAWLYGAHGRCFPRTIASAASRLDRLEVVDDQIGQPTWTVDVARVVRDLAGSAAPGGTYHATSAGHTSWYGFARGVVASAGIDADVVQPVSSSTRHDAAPRPAYSVLSPRSLVEVGVAPIGPWETRWAAAAGAVLPGVRPRTPADGRGD